MGFIYGLAVVLVLFEGIIIPCEVAGGNGTEAEDSSNLRQDGPINNNKNKGIFFPLHIVEQIISKTDLTTLRMAVEHGIVDEVEPLMGGIFRDSIILINTNKFNECHRESEDGGMHEHYRGGNTYLSFDGYQELISFFKKFGDQVTKIAISYDHNDHGEFTKNIINCIKKCAKNLEGLAIKTFDDRTFWKYLTDEKNDIIFPKVKRFQLNGESRQKALKLNLKFPKLESFFLEGYIADVNCLANVTGLKELTLFGRTLKADNLEELIPNLEDIFKNNKNMKKITLFNPTMAETMQSIAAHLKNLETIVVEDPDESFLIRENDDPPMKLLSVTHFSVSLWEEILSIENRSFDMQHLKKLTLSGYLADDRIVNFIKQFEELEAVELFTEECNAVKCIKNLPNIKKFTTTIHKDDFESLRNMIESFDGKSKLQTLEIVFFEEKEEFNRNYENKIKGINLNSGRVSDRPTWTLSHGVTQLMRREARYFKFRRQH